MERRPGSEGGFPVLPENALPCVWMTAGLLAYRLCDRAYECERCPLDAAIRGVELKSPAIAAAVETLPEPEAAPWGIRDDRRYHRSCTWLKPVDEGRLRWGLDGMGARLLDRLTSVVLPAAGTRLLQGEAACWLVDDGELIPIMAPVTATVVRTNPSVQKSPGLVTSSPYDDGWFAELRTPNGAGTLTGLCDAAARTEGAARQMARLQQVALRFLRHDPRVGATLADGGQPITNLRGLLGTRRYHRLVLALLR
jgi:glycine cleavage system H protein